VARVFPRGEYDLPPGIPYGQPDLPYQIPVGVVQVKYFALNILADFSPQPIYRDIKYSFGIAAAFSFPQGKSGLYFKMPTYNV
jgi:hypothetical protein